jgi:alginate O-acetyltransferase complex protein AlgI
LKFNSLAFLAFWPIFTMLFFATRGWRRMAVSFVGSYVFYGWWDWRFLALIVFSTTLDFYVGRWLADETKAGRRKVLLAVSMVANLGLLAFFKYFGFFVDSFVEAFAGLGVNLDGPALQIILPIGISFYTFQTMSYTIDIYKGELQPEKSWLKFATFVAFFPQLVAGPIVRAKTLLPQLDRDRPLDSKEFLAGFQLAIWGFVKKVAIADSVAVVVEAIFAFPETQSSLALIVGMHLYAFQIYLDFSGYSDIAIGIARMLGYQFPLNFNRPYFATSFSDFWRRWHISLSSWLRDYLYIPLGGNRRGKVITYRNLWITMLLGGLWHGANWTFVGWGALHGGYLVVERWLQDPLRRLQVALRFPDWLAKGVMIVVVYHLAAFAFVLFRTPDFGTFIVYVKQMFALENLSPGSVPHKLLVAKSALLIAGLLAVDAASFSPRLARTFYEDAHPATRAALVAGMLVIIAFFGTFRGNAFIYFQF